MTDYILFTTGNNEYKLRLGIRDIITLEKELGGKNPLSVFGQGDTLPTVSEMISILWASAQKYHKLTKAQAYDLLEAWVDDGHNLTEFIPIVVEIYKNAGIIGKEEEPKNA